MDEVIPKLITASGKEYSCAYFGELPQMNVLYIGVPNMTWAEASALFQNESEMEHLTYADRTADGYTHLDYIMREPYGLKAQMSKPR